MKPLLWIGCLLCSATLAWAQPDEAPSDDRNSEIPLRTFRLGLVAGLNAAQIDGDGLAGYNKLGLLLGGRVTYRTSDMWMPSMGIFYAQKGSRSELVLSGNFFETHYQLDYIEVPVMMNFLDGGVRISGGLSYARLIDVDILIDDIVETDDRRPYYRENELNVVLGFGYFIDEHWGFDLRWTRSLYSIADLSVGNVINQPQVNKLLSFRTIYHF